ncbi:putative nucleotidyltransferase [Catalinimonas alkaloidigena]|uniref:lantibiotic dehydratase C-terminal domain-containing protein n=1 Tax=Catalinimonas alkaloidigena TaxID=1075417 RepID=UPI002405EC7E|nr:lantibiotic dehydratase C-terminal domain-containing protein [Catalinimonas alkaloidigena]MDF9799371.1 putative nucleotidyltransferase [Catalinimonas alkaloidigena]
MDYTIIARRFIDQQFPDAQGAILSGSAVTGEMKPHSDLDLLVFYEDIHSHYRKLYHFEGQKIEAMVHRISQSRDNMAYDRKRRNKAFLDLIVKGVIIKDTDQVIASLQTEAGEIYDQGPLPYTPYEKALYHYIINNRLEDFVDNDDYHESYFILSNLFYFLTKVMLIINGQWTNKGQGKWQFRAVEEYDKQLGEQLKKAIDDFCQHQRKDKVITLTKNVLLQLDDRAAAYEAGIPPQYNKVKKWFMVDMYYAEPQEEMLIELIKPSIENLSEMGWAENVFFTRNYKNGAHISLYLVTDKTIFEEHILPYIENTFGSYLSMNPSLRVTPDLYKRLPKKFQLFPNNSFQYYEFEVELMKYMGSEGLKFLEEQFHSSSKFVLDLISQKPGINYNEKLGEVIKINWLVLHTLGLSLQEINLFCENYWKDWGAYQFSTIPGPFIFNDKVSPMPLLKQEVEDKLYQKFEDKFEQQQEQMLGFLGSLWEKSETEGQRNLEEALATYLGELKMSREKITLFHTEEKLFLPDPIQDESSEVKILERYPLWFFYKEIIHATNNRLGVLHENERYLMFLLQACAQHLSLKLQEEQVQL